MSGGSFFGSSGLTCAAMVCYHVRIRGDECPGIKEECNMFSNVGGKIKSLAVAIFWLEVIGAVVAGSAVIITTGGRGESILLGAGIILGGVVVSWLSVLFTYAFGELVENSTYIRAMMERKDR